jgi:hypothetical protein
MASMSGRACTWVLNAISGWAVEVVAGVFNAFFKL